MVTYDAHFEFLSAKAVAYFVDQSNTNVATRCFCELEVVGVDKVGLCSV